MFQSYNLILSWTSHNILTSHILVWINCFVWHLKESQKIKLKSCIMNGNYIKLLYIFIIVKAHQWTYSRNHCCIIRKPMCELTYILRTWKKITKRQNISTQYVQHWHYQLERKEGTEQMMRSQHSIGDWIYLYFIYLFIMEVSNGPKVIDKVDLFW